MELLLLLISVSGLAPIALMLIAAALTQPSRFTTASLWSILQLASALALGFTGLALFAAPETLLLPEALTPSSLGLILAFLVQGLGTVIAYFSARYLAGEPGQRRAIAALALVLAAVQLLLLADHWLVLIASWALVGGALTQLLCFYPDRPLAQLAAHKKRLADRLADVFLIIAAALAWSEIGSGSLSALWDHLQREAPSPALQLSALALVGAVILRTALLPVHGWLIQVMEAPTPVSALLHAGVINLGGFVLIRFAPLLEASAPARGLLLIFGLSTALLAGMVSLTRVSIKVRLAWSTVAQMGFMLLECALGLYSLAALHLIGHSLYKAQAFLSASSVVRETRLRALHERGSPSSLSLWLAPLLAIGTVFSLDGLSGAQAWPWWWSLAMGLAWAPMLWLPGGASLGRRSATQLFAGLLMIGALTALARLAHSLPLGLSDAPHEGFGYLALAGLALLYLSLALLQVCPERLSRWRRWSYAGFFVDEAATRLTLKLWPGRWMRASAAGAELPTNQPALAELSR